LEESLPLVSVILPTYNRAEWLSRAIDSVIAQTYTHWELIVWDDGSTDHTEGIAKAYNNQKIKYHFDDNHGVYYARNRSIQVSRGEYIAFLDSDDEWMDDKLSVQVTAMIAHPRIDLLFTDFFNIRLNDERAFRGFKQCLRAMKSLDVEEVEDDLFLIKNRFLESLTIEDFIATDTVILRREVFDRAGLFKSNIKSSEDYELWWRMALAGVCFAYINKVYLRRYKYPGSLSSSSISMFENRLKVLDLCVYESLTKGRMDLVPYLNGPYRIAWQNMIPMYGNIGDRKGMLNAFYHSLKYGFTLGSIRLLLEAILGQKNNKE
jgi:glycosyltransferase involved in cell wall biosynthesis